MPARFTALSVWERVITGISGRFAYQNLAEREGHGLLFLFLAGDGGRGDEGKPVTFQILGLECMRAVLDRGVVLRDRTAETESCRNGNQPQPPTTLKVMPHSLPPFLHLYEVSHRFCRP